MMEDKFKYTAFISYSHSDQNVVKWLHKALEHYRVPVKLVGKQTSAGEVPGKFKPIFRDRDDLSAASDLSTSIVQALKQSKFLIVVCSPNAAKSKWVEKEIKEFSKVRGADNILCLIAAADPTGRETNFPPALFEGKNKGFEPIAADMRPEADGKRMAKLKLISGILGVELDTLVQRDTKRQQIQMAIAAATFSIATVILSVLLYMAIEAREEAEYNLVLATEARQEAEANRQEAENLVQFMLGDLRSKLEPMGNLQLMDTISERALAYYSSLEGDDMTTEALIDRSKVLLMLGETQELRGNQEAAREAFTEAFVTTSTILERQPDNLDLMYDHLQTVYWLGVLDLNQRNYPAAEEYFLDYAATAENLVELDPDNAGYQMEIGRAYSNLGIVKYAQGKFLGAKTDFEKALKTSTSQAEVNPNSDTRLSQAQTIARLAATNTQLGYFRDAEVLRQQERGIYEVLLNQNPDNRGAWAALARAHEGLGVLSLIQGEEKTSLSYFNRGIEIMEGLTAYDRENTEWRETMASLYINKARALIERRDHAEADAELVKARNFTRGLIRINSNVLDWQLKDFEAQVVQARIRAIKGGKQEALDNIQALAGRFYERFPPDTRTYEQHFLSAEILDVLAEAYRRNGDKEAAKENWASVVKILQPFEASGGLTVISLLPKAQARASD